MVGRYARERKWWGEMRRDEMRWSIGFVRLYSQHCSYEYYPTVPKYDAGLPRFLDCTTTQKFYFSFLIIHLCAQYTHSLYTHHGIKWHEAFIFSFGAWDGCCLVFTYVVFYLIPLEALDLVEGLTCTYMFFIREDISTY